MNFFPKLFTAIFIVGCIVFGITAMTEIVSRQDTLTSLDHKNRHLLTRALEISQRIAADIQENRIRTLDDVLKRQEEYKGLLSGIERINNLNVRLQSLIVAGAVTQNDTLDSITLEYHDVLHAYKTPLQAPNTDILSRELAWFYLWPIYQMRSTYLLALSAILSGLVGALITALRRDKSGLILMQAGMGIAAGIVAFYVIRGGKSVFLLHSSLETVAPINPFSMAFVSFLGGLFTGKVFTLMSQLMNELTIKVRALSGISSREAREKFLPAEDDDDL